MNDPHITKGSVWDDLGFSAEEACILKLKAILMTKLEEKLKEEDKELCIPNFTESTLEELILLLFKSGVEVNFTNTSKT